MQNEENFFSRKSAPQRAARMVETIFGCKWSLTVYQLLNQGIHRPGEMVRRVEGLSKKVLYDCLNKNVEFGILERISFSEVPPRVEYRLTPFGGKFTNVLDQINDLQDELEKETSDDE